MRNLGFTLFDQGKFAEAEAIYREKHRVLHRGRPDSLETLDCLGNLGAALHQQEKYAEAEAVLRDALDGWRRTARRAAAALVAAREAGSHCSFFSLCPSRFHCFCVC